MFPFSTFKTTHFHYTQVLYKAFRRNKINKHWRKARWKLKPKTVILIIFLFGLVYSSPPCKELHLRSFISKCFPGSAIKTVTTVIPRVTEENGTVHSAWQHPNLMSFLGGSACPGQGLNCWLTQFSGFPSDSVDRDFRKWAYFVN
jgi:hypothetical protein